MQIDEKIEETFNYYAENVVNCDEAAAILTLAEVLKGRERQWHPEPDPRRSRQKDFS